VKRETVPFGERAVGKMLRARNSSGFCTFAGRVKGEVGRAIEQISISASLYAIWWTASANYQRVSISAWFQSAACTTGKGERIKYVASLPETLKRAGTDPRRAKLLASPPEADPAIPPVDVSAYPEKGV
jgi:hypothetical protein